jgi:Prokaryotic phospholipase A2
MRKGSGKSATVLGVAAAIVLAGAPSASATGGPAPVPCTSIGGGRHQCSFWPAGDGIHSGSPVQSSSGKRVGFLNYGSNWVVCQRIGGTVTRGSLANDWWAWTEANDRSWGWVNALYGHGGANYGAFRGVPACPASQGFPRGGAPTPTPLPPPPPPPPPPGPTLLQRATAIMNKTYSAFIAYKRNVHPKPFIWSSDGCSIPGKNVPGWVGALVKSVSNLFNEPCQLHDFGYRNFGKGLALAPDENTRHWIDDRFYHEMQRLCNDKYSAWYRLANKEACLNEAHGMFLAVRGFGESSYH